MTETIEAPTVTVDPGQVIRVNARFPGSPENIRFAYLAPQSAAAVRDPGAYEVDTQIQRDASDLYYYSIHTRQMRGGLGWWYFVSEDPDPSKCRAKAGRFIVRDIPLSLYADESVVNIGGDVPPQSKTPMWALMLGSGLGGAAVGATVGALIARHGMTSVDEEIDGDEFARIVVARPRSSDGKFLSTTSLAGEEGEDLEASDETSDMGEDEGAAGPDSKTVLIVLGVAALGALGWWLWRRHREAKEKALETAPTPKQLAAHAATHVGDDEYGSGFDSLVHG